MAAQKSVIIGGGLVGSLLGIALNKKGHDVTIFEKRPDFRKDTNEGGRSINLILTAKGIRPLVEWDLWEVVKPLVVPVTGRIMHAKSGELTRQPYGRNDQECNYSVSRSELNRALLNLATEAGVKVNFESTLEKIDFDNQLVKLDSGKDQPFDLLLGTDGAGSQVRKLLHEQYPDSKATTEPLGTDYKELTMPLNSEGKPAIDISGLHIWPRPGHMLMALPNRDGSFTITAFMPKELFQELDTKEKIVEFFNTQYPDAPPHMPDFADEFLANPVGFLGTARVDRWSNQKNTVLLGDAAHAIVPFFGQGMNSGFSDAWTLVEELERTQSIEKAIINYCDRQIPNGKAVANLSLENFYEMRDAVADPRFLNLKSFEREIEKRYPKIFRSRYSIVTYTLIDYSLAIEFGELTKPLFENHLDAFLGDTIDWKEFVNQLSRITVPWCQRHGVSFDRYQVPT